MAAVAVATATLSTLSPPRFPYTQRTFVYPIPRAMQISNNPSPTPLLLPKALIEIQKSRVIACLRAQDGVLALEAARAALKGGITVLEIVMSTPGVLEVIRELLQEHPSSIIGVGTVLNAEDARKAVHAGAKFLMSPGTIMVLTPISLQFSSYLASTSTGQLGYSSRTLQRYILWEILLDVQDGEVLYIPGIMTPTEILCAYNSGARIVKAQQIMVQA